MAGLPVEKLGVEFEPRRDTITADGALAYAAATNDHNEFYTSAKFAPPVYAVVPAFAALAGAMGELLSPEDFMMLVHGEQDIHYHQPLSPGVELVSRAVPYNIRVGGSGTRLTARVLSDDAAGQPVLEQYFTIFIRGRTEGESGGPDKPDHQFPEDARNQSVGSYSVHVDEDQTSRYAEASGDHNPIHLDPEFAQSVGLPGIINHGLCTMAMTSQAVLATVADGDPSRLKRLAVRFAANVIPGNDVETHIYRVGSADGRAAYAFEAESGGETVIKNGRAEIA